jgi:hypothetical protein
MQISCLEDVVAIEDQEAMATVVVSTRYLDSMH